jgi:hypothetical protein
MNLLELVENISITHNCGAYSLTFCLHIPSIREVKPCLPTTSIFLCRVIEEEKRCVTDSICCNRLYQDTALHISAASTYIIMVSVLRV